MRTPEKCTMMRLSECFLLSLFHASSLEILSTRDGSCRFATRLVAGRLLRTGMIGRFDYELQQLTLMVQAVVVQDRICT